MLDMAKLDGAARRGDTVVKAIESLRSADRARVELQKELDGLRAERNAANQEMASLDKKSEQFTSARDRLRELSQRIKSGETKQSEMEASRLKLHMEIPNALHESVPDGVGEEDNVEVSSWGKKPSYSFEPKPHWEVGEALGILDFERAAKIAGARFCILKGAGSRLARALIQFMLDLHVERGYTEVWPPSMVLTHSLEGTGQLPKFADDAFKVSGDSDLYLSPTAEVQLTNMHREEIMEPGTLPLSLIHI